MPTNWQFPPQTFLLLFALCALWTGAFFAWNLSRRHRLGPKFPPIERSRILFDERWTSGRSLKTWFTRMGGASNCLHVTVTDHELWIRAHFPFTVLDMRCDLLHRVEVSSITRVLRETTMWRGVSVAFRLESGEERVVLLRLRRRREFFEAMRLAGAPVGGLES